MIGKGACLLLFLLMLCAPVYAVQYGSDHSIVLTDGMKASSSIEDLWIQTSGSDMTISKWFVSNWFNYTVSASSTQYVHNGSKPSSVYFDDVLQTEGVTWSYSGGTVTISPTTSANVGLQWIGAGPSSHIVNLSWFFSVALSLVTSVGEWIDLSSPPSVGSSMRVYFTVFLKNKPCPDVQIDVYDQSVEEYQGCCWTDIEGRADMYLPYGHYRFEAIYEDYKVEGNWIHRSSETIRIHLDAPAKTRISPIIRTSIYALLFISVIAVVVYGLSRVWR